MLKIFLAGMKVSVVRNRFREDKIFKGKLDRVNALIKMVTPISYISSSAVENHFSIFVQNFSYLL